jgi:L-threonylcarbamoyladenylate synthase
MRSGADSSLARAVGALRRGEPVAVPTETYWALAVHALDAGALARLLEIKGRAESHTLSLLVEPEMLDRLVTSVPARAQALMDAHWPGPLTLALPARAGLPPALVQDGCVAVRVSPHPLARALVRAFGGPLTATSANPTGQPPARQAAEVHGYFPTVTLLGDETTPGGPPSTIVRVTSEALTILRRGAVALEE